jgi:hypothetical protein
MGDSGRGIGNGGEIARDLDGFGVEVQVGQLQRYIANVVPPKPGKGLYGYNSFGSPINEFVSCLLACDHKSELKGINKSAS